MGFGSLCYHPPTHQLFELVCRGCESSNCQRFPLCDADLCPQPNSFLLKQMPWFPWRKRTTQLVQFVSTKTLLKADEKRRWEKYPISSPTLFSWEKPKTREGLIQQKTPGIRCGSFFNWSSQASTWHESCFYGGGFSLYLNGLRSRNICITLGGQAKHLFHHLCSSRFFTHMPCT